MQAFAKWTGAYENLTGGIQNIAVPLGTSRAIEAVVDAPTKYFNLKNINPLTGEVGVSYEQLNDWLAKVSQSGSPKPRP